MSHRTDFLEAVESLLGMPVLWAQKGPDAYDCSGLVTACLRKVGGPDLRYTHNSATLAAKTRALLPTEKPEPADLVFYGDSPDAVTHVAVVDAYGGVVSADGATSHILDLKTALKNEHNRVRRHAAIDFRRDLKWFAAHRNTLVDELDAVTR